MLGKWEGFRNDKKYSLQDLGRPAVFLIPIEKLKDSRGGKKAMARLDVFLTTHFTAFTKSRIPSFGLWQNGKGDLVYDECYQYEVSFVGKEKIPMLLENLATFAGTIGEEYIYFKAGQYACLVGPPKHTS